MAMGLTVEEVNELYTRRIAQTRTRDFTDVEYARRVEIAKKFVANMMATDVSPELRPIYDQVQLWSCYSCLCCNRLFRIRGVCTLEPDNTPGAHVYSDPNDVGTVSQFQMAAPERHTSRPLHTLSPAISRVKIEQVKHFAKPGLFIDPLGAFALHENYDPKNKDVKE